MPLAIRLKAVNAVIPKKRFYEKSNFCTSRGIKKSRSFKILFYKRLPSFQSNISSKVRENQRGFEAGPERGGLASVSELVVNRQNCTKTDHLKIPLFSSRLLRIFDDFHLKASFKLSLFFKAGNKVTVTFYLLKYSLFIFLRVVLKCQEQSTLHFMSDTSKFFLDET